MFILLQLTSIRKTCNKIFSAFINKQKLRNCKEKIIDKCEKFLRPLAQRRSWRQVVPNYSQCQDVLWAPRRSGVKLSLIIVSVKILRTPRRSWRQVVPNYSQRQDVLRDKKVASSCPCEVGRTKMSRTSTHFLSYLFSYMQVFFNIAAENSEKIGYIIFSQTITCFFDKSNNSAHQSSN